VHLLFDGHHLQHSSMSSSAIFSPLVSSNRIDPQIIGDSDVASGDIDPPMIGDIDVCCGNVVSSMSTFESEGFCHLSLRHVLAATTHSPSDLEMDAYHEAWSSLPADPVSTYSFRGISQARFLLNPQCSTVSRLCPVAYRLDYNNNATLGDTVREFGEPVHDVESSKVDMAVVEFLNSVLRKHGQSQGEYLMGYTQIRITSSVDMQGLPTAEGVHQDGAELVMVMFVKGHNLTANSGESRVYSLDQPLGPITDESKAQQFRKFQHTMRDPFEAVLLSDRKVKHDNLPVVMKDPSLPATRDVLVCWMRPVRYSGPDADDLSPHVTAVSMSNL
jgi:hypothetical protein